jgi:hypothetical protein
VDGAIGDSLTARLFKTRLEVVGTIDARREADMKRDFEGEVVLRRDVVDSPHPASEAPATWRPNCSWR